MMTLGFLAVSQYGETLRLTGRKHPRKQLLEQLSRKHADKIYVDTKDGTARHVGWIVGGSWWNVYRVCPLNG